MKDYNVLITQALGLISDIIPLAVQTGKLPIPLAQIYVASLGIYISMSDESKDSAYNSFDHLITTIVRSV